AELSRFLNGQSVRVPLPAGPNGADAAGANAKSPSSASIVGPGDPASSASVASPGIPASPSAAANPGDPASREVRAHASDGRLLAIAALDREGLCGPRKMLHKGGP